MMTPVQVGGRGSIGRAGPAWKCFALSLIAGRIGDPACIWQGSGGSVSVEGDTRMVLAWYGPARESAEPAAGALCGPGAMMATGAAGQLWAGRWYPVAARTAGPGNQIDVVSNQYV
jgi:hypothetical protein